MKVRFLITLKKEVGGLWRKLDESVELKYRDLDKKLLNVMVGEKTRIVVIMVRGGVAFCGRPLYHWTCSLKGRKLPSGRVLLTHWAYRGEPVPMGSATLGFSIFFPEIIEGAYYRPSVAEQEEFVWGVVTWLRERAVEG